jgi:hypothetical protein
MAQDNFEKELNTIFREITPGEEFHTQLESLGLRMEDKYPALNNLPQSLAKVPNGILKTYALALIAVIYDKNCAESLNGHINPLERSEIEKARRVQFAIETILKIDPQHIQLPHRLSKRNLHLYGYLLMLMTNYDNDHQLKDEYSCIMQMKFIIDLFRQHFPSIDESPQKNLNGYFSDADTIRLYILCKLSYADMLLNADSVLRDRLGAIASFAEIHKVYSQQILERFSGTRHLTPQQIIDINLAIEELNSKRELATHPTRLIPERSEDDIHDAALGLISLRNLPDHQEKRSFEQLFEESQDEAAKVVDIQASFSNSPYSFTANINLHLALPAQSKSQKKYKGPFI